MTPLHRRPLLAVPALLALLGAQLLIGLLPATLQQASAEPETNTGRPAPSMIILDASGSMREPDIGGESRMAVAKQGISGLIPQLPEDAQIGLMTYGNSTEATVADKKAACQDIKVLVKPTGMDREALAQGVDSITARGFTPIGASLRTAVAELPEAEIRSVVLISDGIEECDTTPPCDVAKDIASKHPEVRIHTIGFKTDDAARTELACIAEATGGTYADASDAETLRDALLMKMTRATKGYDTSGQPLTGGKTPDEATPITPGSHLDVLETGSPEVDDGEGDVRYYRMHLEEGEIAHLAATMVLPAGTGTRNKLAQVSIELTDPEGRSCRAGATGVRAESDLGKGPITATLSTPRKGETKDLTCFGADTSGDVIIEVARSGSPSQEEAVPLELQFFAEQEVAMEDLPPAAQGTLEREPLPAATTGEPHEPSFAYADATTLGDGPVQGTIIPGEVQFFRIPVQYGQQVRSSFRVDSLAAPTGMDLTTQVSLVSPLREEVYTTVPPSTDASAGGFTGPTVAGEVVHLNQAAPVQFRNREDGSTEARSAFLAGDYYLKVAATPTTYDASRLFEIPYVIDADVVGEVSPGPEIGGQGDAARADRSASDPGAAPATVDGASDAGGEVSADPDLQPPPEDEGIPVLVWVILGSLLGGVAIAGGVIGLASLVRRS